jgi:hypothetical protein
MHGKVVDVAGKNNRRKPTTPSARGSHPAAKQR